MSDVLVVEADGQPIGVPASAVVEVLPCARWTRLAKAPPFVAGVLNLRGEVLPVLSMRERLGRPLRAPSPDDHLVLVDLGRRRVLLHVDRALELIEVDPAVLAPLDERHGSHAGAVPTPVGVLLVEDPERFLTSEELDALEGIEGPG